MAKRENWVRLDIAPFCMAVVMNRGNLEDWTLSLAESLAEGRPELNEFGARLLGEKEEYRLTRAEAGRKRWEQNPNTSPNLSSPQVSSADLSSPQVPLANTSNDVLSCTVVSCTDKEKEELRKEWNNSNPARGIGGLDDHGNQNGTGTGTQRHVDGGRASGTGAGLPERAGSGHEPSDSHGNCGNRNEGAGPLPHRQPEPAQAEPRPGDRNRAPLTPAGCGLAPQRRPLGAIDAEFFADSPVDCDPGDSSPVDLGRTDEQGAHPQHAQPIPACGGPDATTNAIAPLDGVAAGQQTANRGAVGLFDANPAGRIREAPKAGTNGKSVAKRGNAVLLSESESALAVWKAFPSKSRERSSPTQFRKAWNEQRKLGLPSIETLIDAVQGWAQSEKWSKDNGQYQEGAHRWLAGRQWENLPDRLKTFEEQMAAELEATNERFRELGCEC